ncbi:MAG: right-handed parallel beta-helix repeat-containing protein [Verrucomicrobia bacterium]|nr:right-handed parallel beta-helix repeat-containing protein [Verrucomicrobiota bacterium]
MKHAPLFRTIVVLQLLCLDSATVFAQGSLTPPGAPAPLFKTLTQIEPRTPIGTYGTNITVAGSYYLSGNLTSSLTNSDGITISTDNVTVDFNGFAIINTGGVATQSDGISFTARNNVTIKNGTITGFYRGIFANGDSGGVVVENMRLATNYFRGISLLLQMGAAGGIVRNNYAYGTGGTIVGLADQEIRSIEVSGAKFTIENNVVQHTYGKGLGGGYGIFSTLGTNMVINNKVSHANFGIRLNGPDKFRDNIVSNTATNYIAGTDIGNNN